MAKLSVDIPADLVKGITAARTAFNASLPDQSPDLVGTDEEYFSLRAIGMVGSWADEFGVSDKSQDKAKEEFIAKLPPEKRAAIDAMVTAELAKP